ncbi:hypothetical protein PHJA_002420900 [Phtheirospermum japonicum]|uniref:Uncharacterized protein n=1 Tax=Phtheirospermum japonicum TaxID=374723 RepID=A0A830CUQ8_9LAMI|nr:hypothetical protein PHJA_002420900 [Phtheirospermum japonicum]
MDLTYQHRIVEFALKDQTMKQPSMIINDATTCNKNRRRERSRDNSSSSAALESFKQHLSGGQKNLKSLIFHVNNFDDWRDYWYKISHNYESGTPMLTYLFKSADISDEYNVTTQSHHEIDDWVKSDFKLPTPCSCFFPGAYRDWLYLIGFNSRCSNPDDNPFGCGDGCDRFIWGSVYNVGDVLSQYSLEPPLSCSPLSSSLIVGPYKDEVLVVYIKQDNTLYVHNPVERKWKTLVENIVEKNDDATCNKNRAEGNTKAWTTAAALLPFRASTFPMERLPPEHSMYAAIPKRSSNSGPFQPTLACSRTQPAPSNPAARSSDAVTAWPEQDAVAPPSRCKCSEKQRLINFS